MGKQAKVVKARKCLKCGKEFSVTAAEIKDHASECTLIQRLMVAVAQ